MNFKINKLFVLVFIGLSACGESHDYYIGKWQITHIHIVSNSTRTPLNDNWMHLKQDRTFESYDGNLKKKETGVWKYESSQKRLFIDGAGDKNDSEWRLSVKNDTLFFHSITGDIYLIANEIE